LDAFIDSNELIIIFEWAEAGDLKRQVRKAQEREARFDERVIWKYFVQICEAINHMHEKRGATDAKMQGVLPAHKLFLGFFQCSTAI
jgi:serine/threonine protein kinase